jgi:hypothetical protein
LIAAKENTWVSVFFSYCSPLGFRPPLKSHWFPTHSSGPTNGTTMGDVRQETSVVFFLLLLWVLIAGRSWGTRLSAQANSFTEASCPCSKTGHVSFAVSRFTKESWVFLGLWTAFLSALNCQSQVNDSLFSPLKQRKILYCFSTLNWFDFLHTILRLILRLNQVPFKENFLVATSAASLSFVYTPVI